MKKNFTTQFIRYVLLLTFLAFHSGVQAQFCIERDDGTCSGTSVIGCEPLQLDLTATDVSASCPTCEYRWTFGDGNSITVTTLNVSKLYKLPLNDADGQHTYTLTLEIIDGGVVQDTYNGTVEIYALPNAEFTSTPRNGCLTGGSHAVTFEGPAGFAQYDWEFDDGNSVSVNTATYVHSYTQQGDFKPTLIVTDVNGCRSSYTAPDSEQISVSNGFDVEIDRTIGDDSSCTPPLRATFAAVPPPNPPTSPYTTTWNFDGGTIISSDPANETYEVEWDTPGTKNITLVAEQNGCIQTKNTTVTIEQIDATFNVSNGSGCAPLQTLFTNTTSQLPRNEQIVTWTITDTGGNIIAQEIRDGTNNDDVINFDYTFPTPNTNYNVTLQVTDANAPPQCDDTSDPETIEVFEEVIADFTADPTFSCLNSQLVNFDAGSSSPNADTYNWTFTDAGGNVIGNRTGETPDFTFTGFGTYGVQLEVSNSTSNCSDIILREQYITLEPLIADFSFLPPERCVPGNAEAFGLVVGGCVNPTNGLTFSPSLFNLSNGVGGTAGVTYLWEVFNNTNTIPANLVATSTMEDPTDIILAEEGRYTIRLTINNPLCGIDEEVKENYIYVGLQPDNIDFEAQPKIICNGETVTYPRINSTTMLSYIDDNDDIGSSAFPPPEYYYNYLAGNDIMDQAGSFTYDFSDPNPVSANMWYYHNGCFECVEDKDETQHFSNIKLPKADAEFFQDPCQPDKVFFTDLSLAPARDRDETAFPTSPPNPFGLEWSFTYVDDGTVVPMATDNDGNLTTIYDRNPVIQPDPARQVNWSVTVRASCDPSNPFTKCDVGDNDGDITCENTLTGSVTIPDFDAATWDALITNGITNLDGNRTPLTPVVEGCQPVNGVAFDGAGVTIPGTTIRSYYLEFGNGEILRATNPADFNATINYTEPGLYSLRMVLTTAQGCRFVHDYIDWIKVTGPEPIFDYCEAGTCADDAIDNTNFFERPNTVTEENLFAVRFNDLSVSLNPIEQWDWNFGDGTTLQIVKNSNTDYVWTWSYDADGDGTSAGNTVIVQNKMAEEAVYYSYNTTNTPQDGHYTVTLTVTDNICAPVSTSAKVRPTKPEIASHLGISARCYGSVVTFVLDDTNPPPITEGILPYQGAQYRLNATNIEILEGYHPDVTQGTYDVAAILDYNINSNRWDIQLELTGTDNVTLNRNSFPDFGSQTDINTVSYYFPGIDGGVGGVNAGAPTSYSGEFELLDVNRCPDIEVINFPIINYSLDVDFETSLNPDAVTDLTLFEHPASEIPARYNPNLTNPALSDPLYEGNCPPQDIYVNAIINLNFTSGAGLGPLKDMGAEGNSFGYPDLVDTTGIIDFSWDYRGDETITKNQPSPAHFFTYPNPQDPLDPYDIAVRIVDENGCEANLTYYDILDLRGPRGTYTADEELDNASQTPPIVRGYADEPFNPFTVEFVGIPEDPMADFAYLWDYGVGILGGGEDAPLKGRVSTFTYTENFIDAGNDFKDYTPILFLSDGSCTVAAPETTTVSVYRCPTPDLGLDQTLCVSEGDVVLQPFPDGFSAPMPNSTLQYEWFIDGGTTPISTDPTLTVPAIPGDHTYRVRTSVMDNDIAREVCVFENAYDASDPNNRFANADTDNEVNIVFYDFADAIFSFNPSLSVSTGYGGAEVVCVGEMVTIDENSQGPLSGPMGTELPILEWNWTVTRQSDGFVFPTVNNITDANFVFTPATPDTYEVQLEIIPQAIGGVVCGDVVTTQFIAVPPPEPDFTPLEVCFNDPTTFANNTTYAVDQAINEANATYLWQFYDPSNTLIHTSTDFEPTYTFTTEPDTYVDGQIEYTATLIVNSNIKDDGSGCEEITPPIIIRVNPLPEIDFTDVNACPDEIIEIRPSVTNSNFLYTWTQVTPTSGGTIEFYSDALATNPALLSDGLEAYYLRLGSFNGINTPVEAEFQLLVTDNTYPTLCQTQENISISFNPLPEIEQLDQEECEDVDITTGTSADPNHERYEWSIADPLDDFTNGTVQYFISSDLASPRTLANINASNGGLGHREIVVRAEVDAGLNEMIGTLQLEVFTAAGCSDIVRNRLQFNPIPEVDLGDNQEVCEGTDVTVGIPFNTNFQYVWSEGVSGGTIQYFNPSDLSSPLDIAQVNAANLSEIIVRGIISGQNTINVDLTLEVTDNNFTTACINTDDISVQINPLPDVVQLDQSACENEVITTGITALSGFSYEWEIASAFTNGGIPSFFTPTGTPISLSAANTSEIQVRMSDIANPSIGTMRLIVTNIITGCSETVENELIFNPLPDSNLGPDQEVCENTDVTIGVSNTSGFDYTWTPTNLNGGSFQYFNPSNLSQPLTINQVNAANAGRGLSEIIVRGVFTGQNPVTADFNLRIIDQRFGTNCTTEDDITLQFNPEPENPLVALPPAVCEDGQIVVEVPGLANFQYDWEMLTTTSNLNFRGSGGLTKNITTIGDNSITITIDEETFPLGQGIQSFDVQLTITDLNYPTRCENIEVVTIDFYRIPKTETQAVKPGDEGSQAVALSPVEEEVDTFEYQWTQTNLEFGTITESSLTGHTLNITNPVYNFQEPQIKGRYIVNIRNADTDGDPTCEGSNYINFTLFRQPRIIDIEEYRLEPCSPRSTLTPIGDEYIPEYLYDWSVEEVIGGDIQVFEAPTDTLFVTTVGINSFDEGSATATVRAKLKVRNSLMINTVDNAAEDNAAIVYKDLIFYRTPDFDIEIIKADSCSQNASVSTTEELITGFDYRWTEQSISGGTFTNSSLNERTVNISSPQYDLGSHKITADYELQVVNAAENACQLTKSLPVEIYRTPQVTIQKDQDNVCQDERITLNPIEEPIAGFDYSWELVSITEGCHLDINAAQEPVLKQHTIWLDNPTFAPQATVINATYKLVAFNKDAPSCRNEAFVDVTVYRTPNVQAKFELNNVCDEDTIYMDLYQAKVDNFNYQWSIVDGTLEGGTINLTDANDYLVKANAASFTGSSTKVSAKLRITVTNPDKVECTNLDEIDIAFFRKPDISISVDNTEDCEDGMFTFSLNEAVNENYNYTWEVAGKEGGSIEIIEESSSLIKVANPTFHEDSSKLVLAYRLRASNKENAECFDTDSRQVTFYRTPKVAIPQPDSICDGVISLAPIEKEIDGFTYEWVGSSSGGSLNERGLDEHQLRLRAESFSAAGIKGNYILKVTNTEFPSCTSTDTVSVYFSRVPILAAQEDIEFCRGEGSPVTLSAVDTPEEGVIYRWFELNQNGENLGTVSRTTELVLNNETIQSAGIRYYRITAFDPNNPSDCDVADTVRVAVYPNPILSFRVNKTVSNEEITFINQTVLETDASGNPILGSEITEWSWDFGDGIGKSALQNPSYVYEQSGTYQVTLTANTNNDCTASFTQEIIINPKPTAIFTAQDACISNQPVQFFETSTLEVPRGFNDVINSWLWDFGDNSGLREGQNPTHSYDAPGTYNVTLVVGTNNNAFDTLTKEINILPIIPANFTFQNTCVGQSVNFQHILNDESLKENIVRYSWNFGNGATFVSENADSNTAETTFDNVGVYDVTLTVTTQQGCEETFSQKVPVYPIAIAKFTLESNCINQDVRFESISTLENVDGIDTRIVSYSWDFGDGTTYNSIDAADRIVRHQFEKEGIYIVKLTATTDLGCSSFIEQEVTINPEPIASFTISDVSCGNEAVNFTSNSTIETGKIVNYKWDFGDDATYESTSLTDSTAQHKYSTYGVFTVKLTVTSDSGCVNTLEKDILINPAPIARFSAPPVCEGSESTVDASLSTLALGQIIKYEWDFDNDGTYEVSTNQAIAKNTFDAFGDYRIGLKITSDKGCVDTLSQVHTVTPFPIAGFRNSRACLGSPTEFTADINSFVDIVSYEWDFNYNGSRASFDALGTEVAFTYSTPGQYQVLHRITTISGCVDEFVKSVVIDDLPTVNAGPDQFICIGDTVTLSAEGNGDEFAWNTGARTQSIVASPTENTSYIVSVTTEIGCFSYDTVNVIILPKVDLAPVAQGCEGETIQLTATNNEINKFNNVSYLWSNNETTASIEVTESGTYQVRVVVSEGGKQCISIDSTVVTINPLPTNTLPSDTTACFEDGPIIFDKDSAGVVAWTWRDLGVSTSKVSINQEGIYYVDMFTEAGCTDLDSVRVWQVCDPEIYFPTAFSPNNDGLNDTFHPKGKYFVNYELTIYNRWGEVIFRTRDPFEGWNGVYLFDEMPSGTYAYMVKYSGEKISFNGRKVAGKLITEYGSVSLIR